ncbi:hypothetical protein ILUMI_07916 [Ignelater luminosus]|uniref:Gag-pol polyprotein n=1 Tax=Ignelater luminosus TaxID=2038154 RepID=A0A8K0GB58_IGNLU|nr:hypothetical protein ILUMI_07916 [Ignelater luminosus]
MTTKASNYDNYEDNRNYLPRCLKGEAGQVIEALDVTAANYSTAWDLLQERFENKRLIIDRHIQGILSLPTIKQESAIPPRTFLDTIQKNMRSLQALEINTSSWDTLLIYICAQKFDLDTKREWESSTSDTNIFPTLKEFTDFFLRRCQLLEKIDPGSKCKGNLQLLQRSLLHLESDTNININPLTQNNIQNNDPNTGSNNASTSTNTNNDQYANQVHYGNQGSSIVAYSSQAKLAQHLLFTALVHILDHHGNQIECRLLLDAGSQSSFMRNEMGVKLHVKTTKINLPIIGINQASRFIENQVRTTVK